MAIPRRRRQYEGVFAPSLGLDYRSMSTMLDKRATNDCLNVLIGAHVVQKAPGTSVYAYTDSSPLHVSDGDSTTPGAVVALNPYRREGLTTELMAHTADMLYMLNADASGFTRINDAGGDPFTETTTRPNDATVWYVTMYHPTVAKDVYIYGDGTNNVQYLYQDSVVPYYPADLDAVNFGPCNWGVVYGERLCTYGYSSNYQLVKWSAVGDPSDFTTRGYGQADLRSHLLDGDTIIRAEKLAESVIVYAQHSIAIQNYTGNVDNPFSFASRVPNKGLAAAKALISLNGQEHIFLGWDSIYHYTGGRTCDSISKAIDDELFRAISPENIGRSFMVHLEDLHRIRLYYPTGSDTFCSEYYELNLVDMCWSKGRIARRGSEYCCAGAFVERTDKYIDDIDIYIDDAPDDWYIDDAFNSSEYPTVLIGDENGGVSKVDRTVRTYNGSDMESWFATKLFVVGDPNDYIRRTTTWMELNFEARGNGTLTVYYSTEDEPFFAGSAAYGTIGIVTLTSGWSNYNLDFEVYDPRLKLCFYNYGNESWSIRQFSIGYVLGSDR